MTRSGRFAAARAATAAKGHAAGLSQSCTARPSSRQPVSPNTAIRRTVDGRTGKVTPSALRRVVPSGARASHTCMGKLASGRARTVLGRTAPSAATCGQAAPGAMTARTERAPSAPSSTQAFDDSDATAAHGSSAASRPAARLRIADTRAALGSALEPHALLHGRAGTDTFAPGNDVRQSGAVNQRLAAGIDRVDADIGDGDLVAGKIGRMRELLVRGAEQIDEPVLVELDRR